MTGKEISFLDECHKKLDNKPKKYLCGWDSQKPITLKSCDKMIFPFCTNKKYCNWKVLING